jgi:hypothetical protein
MECRPIFGHNLCRSRSDKDGQTFFAARRQTFVKISNNVWFETPACIVARYLHLNVFVQFYDTSLVFSDVTPYRLVLYIMSDVTHMPEDSNNLSHSPASLEVFPCI